MKNKICLYRGILGLTQEECAKKLHISKNAVSDIEIGNYNPSLITAYKFSLLFNVPITTIFDFSDITLKSNEELEGQVSI